MDIQATFLKCGGLRPIGGASAFLPLTEEDIALIRTMIRGELPELYESYLRLYGAAAFVKDVLVNPVLPFPPSVSSTGKDGIQAFYGKDVTGRSMFNLFERMEVYQDRMPPTLIPIADNGFGNQYCIGINGPEFGRVYYWDRHGEFDPDEYVEEQGINAAEFSDGEDICSVPPEVFFRNVYSVGQSFEDFLCRISLNPSQSS